ncbi:MAG: helix-turn-helix transcriptional regulator [Gammaproteobacteria bacterium]
MNNPHIGSDFDDFLHEEGLLAECQSEAIKRVLAWQIKEYMEKKGIKKSIFAQRMGTSRSQLDRLLDPENTSLNLKTLANAAEAMGKHLEIRLV